MVFGFTVISHFSPETAQFAGLVLTDIEVDGHYTKADEPDPEVGREHGDQRHDGIGKQREYINEKVLNQAGKAADTGIDTGLQFTAFIFGRGVKGQSVGEDLFYNGLGEISCDQDTKPFAVIFLTELHHGVDHFFPQQDTADHRQQGEAFAQRFLGHHEVGDGVYRKAQDIGVHLGSKRADNSQRERQHYQPVIRPYKGPEFFI